MYLIIGVCNTKTIPEMCLLLKAMLYVIQCNIYSVHSIFTVVLKHCIAILCSAVQHVDILYRKIFDRKKILKESKR